MNFFLALYANAHYNYSVIKNLFERGVILWQKQMNPM